MENEYEQTAKDMLMYNSCEELTHKEIVLILSELATIDELCKRAGGRLKSRQIVAGVIAKHLYK